MLFDLVYLVETLGHKVDGVLFTNIPSGYSCIRGQENILSCLCFPEERKGEYN